MKLALLVCAWLYCAFALAAPAACVPVSSWVAPPDRRVHPDAVLDAAAAKAVVLLGEEHDNAEHHRWQLHTLAALHARRANLILGFEMFPRRVQAALDRWVAGELDAGLEAFGRQLRAVGGKEQVLEHARRSDPLEIPLYLTRVNGRAARAASVAMNARLAA